MIDNLTGLDNFMILSISFLPFSHNFYGTSITEKGLGCSISLYLLSNPEDVSTFLLYPLCEGHQLYLLVQNLATSFW